MEKHDKCWRLASAPAPARHPDNSGAHRRSAADQVSRRAGLSNSGGGDGGREYAETRDRTGDLQIFSLTLSQLS